MDRDLIAFALSYLSLTRNCDVSRFEPDVVDVLARQTRPGFFEDADAFLEAITREQARRTEEDVPPEPVTTIVSSDERSMSSGLEWSDGKTIEACKARFPHPCEFRFEPPPLPDGFLLGFGPGTIEQPSAGVHIEGTEAFLDAHRREQGDETPREVLRLSQDNILTLWVPKEGLRLQLLPFAAPLSYVGFESQSIPVAEEEEEPSPRQGVLIELDTPMSPFVDPDLNGCALRPDFASAVQNGYPYEMPCDVEPG